jgi:hypothetical protein
MEILMTLRRFLPLAVLVAVSALATFTYAGGAIPLVANFSTSLITPDGSGVFGDNADPYYPDGVGGVKCYLGVGGKNVVLVTYDTDPVRTLRFVPDGSPAWSEAGLTQPYYDAKVDLYVARYSGALAKMANGSYAQVHATLQFYVGRNTYELVYQSLGAYREDDNTWLISSDRAQFLGQSFTPCDQAALKVFRRKSPVGYGAVNMPIRFEVTIAP